jgi:hypothetical protein
MNKIDDLLGTNDETITKVPNSTNNEEDFDKDGLPNLKGKDFPPEFLKIVEQVKSQYKCLKKIDYDALYKELSDLSIKSSLTPTLQVLNDEIQKIQAAKDRLAEISIDVIRVYHFKNRIVDFLQESWGKFTTEKNAEGRKGDAVFRLSSFIIDFTSVEALYRVCLNILKNLDSAHESLSRRISIWQLTLKIQDVGRGSIDSPDFYENTNKEEKEKPSLDVF